MITVKANQTITISGVTEIKGDQDVVILTLDELNTIRVDRFNAGHARGVLHETDRVNGLIEAQAQLKAQNDRATTVAAERDYSLHPRVAASKVD